MQLSDFVGKPCSSQVSFEFKPKNKVEIDLVKAKKELESFCKIEIESKFLLIVVINFKTVSIFKNGKLMVRGEKDQEKAKEAINLICNNLKESISEN
jgi:TATA-box binding protein (TBP) (component of TFIID and TFIIIB)